MLASFHQRSPAIALLLALASIAPRSNAHAQVQGAAPLLPGWKVRTQAPLAIGGQRVGRADVVGYVVAQFRDTLVLRSADGQAELRLPLDSLDHVEVSQGKRRLLPAMKGALVGALVGVAVGLGDPIECDDEGRGEDCLDGGRRPSRAEHVGILTSGASLVGAGIGAWVGAERWRRFELHPRIMSTSRGAALMVTLRD